MIKTIVVDNDALIRDIVQKILEDNSQIELIHKAEDGFDALEYLEINKVDLVLLDIGMPKINGIEVEVEDHKPKTFQDVLWDEFF